MGVHKSPREAHAEPPGFTYFDFAAGDSAFFEDDMEDPYGQYASHDDFADTADQAEEGIGAENETRSETHEAANGARPKPKPIDESSAVREFCAAFKDAVAAARLPRASNCLPWLTKLAEACDLARFYARSAVETLLEHFKAAIGSQEWASAADIKVRKQILVKRVHPDKNRKASVEVQKLCNDITGYLLQIM